MDNTILSESSHHFAHLIDLFCFKGRPKNLDSDRQVMILINHGYVTGFSLVRNQPVWTAYRVSAAREDVDYARPHLFYEDFRLPKKNRITTWTFKNQNGRSYDRGHMVPNYAINTQFGRLAQMETFFMSNICPQESATNQGVWQKLEKKIIQEYAPEKDHVWVLTGPIFDKNPKRLKRRGSVFVDIPISFYCILVDPVKWPHDRVHNVEFLTLEIPQEAGRAQLDNKFITSISDIEGKTKLDFFSNMTKTDRKVVDDHKAAEIWGMRKFIERTKKASR